MSWLKSSLALALASSVLTPAAAQAWTRSYLIEWMAPSFYYGAPANGGEETPGSDCPNGINPEMNWKKDLVKSYRSQKEVDTILNPEHRGQGGQYYEHFGFRGPLRDNVYENPTANADPGFVEVSGSIATGFDLDDNPATGFTSPDGVKGVDNAYYRASGCINTFRGVHKNAYFFKSSNDRMRDGERTMLMVVSGDSADPMNDDNVTIGLYGSKDDIVKDANGAATSDLTFSVDPKHQSVFKGKITGGVLEATDRPLMHFQYSVRGSGERSYTNLFKAKIRLETQADGTMKGMVGGYRKFFDHYAEMASYGQTVGGAIHEQLGHYSLPGWYYSLRRNADGLKDAQSGANMGISTAYDLYLVPAFVMTPDNSAPVRVAEAFK